MSKIYFWCFINHFCTILGILIWSLLHLRLGGFNEDLGGPWRVDWGCLLVIIGECVVPLFSIRRCNTTFRGFVVASSIIGGATRCSADAGWRVLRIQASVEATGLVQFSFSL